ncbi:hypothetical protein ELH33_33040 (plasmid) [Rhizobium ruizarguesonis]|uniref:hypothetical protein n=1 Tax=Rhizobium ruizarguesonis TaxID=2081791 RepID=UPI001031BF54|nr:hypothetical protein [Rhizobium ruizarguesonis]TBC25603.1 hypothetical protein ELH33_33040 [Rhizobium ruizarguesonis]
MTTAEAPFPHISVAAETSPGPRWLPWPIAGNPGGQVHFASYGEWETFFLRFDLHVAVPDIVRKKFARAMKLHLLAWVDLDLIKAGELVAWTALELALTDVYKHRIVEKRRVAAALKGKEPSERVNLSELLRHMEKNDGLTDANIPLVQKSGGSVIGRFSGTQQPALNQLRNDLAHGYPFDGLLQSGLIELLRDLIEYAYRDRIEDYKAWQR